MGYLKKLISKIVDTFIKDGEISMGPLKAVIVEKATYFKAELYKKNVHFATWEHSFDTKKNIINIYAGSDPLKTAEELKQYIIEEGYKNDFLFLDAEDKIMGKKEHIQKIERFFDENTHLGGEINLEERGRVFEANTDGGFIEIKKIGRDAFVYTVPKDSEEMDGEYENLYEEDLEEIINIIEDYEIEVDKTMKRCEN